MAGRPWPRASSTLRDVIATNAVTRPDAPALLAPGARSLSYRGLLGQVDRVADALRDRGVASGARVALALPDGPEAVVALLAVTTVATAAPLNPVSAGPEMEARLLALKPRALLAAHDDHEVTAVAAALAIPVLRVHRAGTKAGLFSLEGTARHAAPPSRGGKSDVALILPTSGTTSRPKLVPLTHRNLLAGARSVAAALGLAPADRCLGVMPLFHVHGLVASVLATLATGGSVVCTGGFVPSRFLEWWWAFRPTWFTAVPTLHHAIAAEAEARAGSLPDPGFRLIRSCSAPLAPTLLDRLEAAFGCPVVEAYGMTEAAHQIASNPLPPGARKPGTVGRPAGCDVAVTDDAGRPVPAGAVGEIVIRGESVTQGYIEDPDANREAFRNGWLRTGDEGRLDADGYLTLTGRRKEMINRAGEKIAPAEVEASLVSHPAVARAAVFALPDPELGEDVAAAVVLRPGCGVSEQALRAHVITRLAAFKAPRRIVFVADIPTGPTGKVQRVTLAGQLGLRPADEQPSTGRGAGARPHTRWERAVARAYAEALGVSDVGMDDDFYRLGGTSLKAVRLVLRLARDLGTDIPVRAVFDHSTVGQLAAVVAGAAGEGRTVRPVTSNAADSSGNTRPSG